MRPPPGLEEVPLSPPHMFPLTPPGVFIKGRLAPHLKPVPMFGPATPVSYTHLTLPTNREV
eukprot:13365211-Heterocapsa_arctica.AAC.1